MLPSKYPGAVQKLLAHPAGFLVAFLIAIWELAHLFDVLWAQTPSWLKTTLVAVVSSFHQSLVLALILVFLVGVVVGALGHRFVRAALVKLLRILDGDGGPGPTQGPSKDDSS